MPKIEKGYLKDPTLFFPFCLFFLLLIHGSSLGLSDDEAYYWVLGQRLSLGYAFHPPAVAVLISVFQFLFGWTVGHHSAALVRLPAVLASSFILWMVMVWFREAGQNNKRNEMKAALVLLSYFGFFALSWMMVPDIPLFLGWTILFVHTWRFCFGDKEKNQGVGLFFGSAILILSKYSGLLAVFSSFLCMVFWSPRGRAKKGLFYLAMGTRAGLTPTIIWNYSHQWASILYQIRDRHEGGTLSLVRYLRFWAIEIILAGPWVIGYFFVSLKEGVFSFSKRTAINGSDKQIGKNFILAWALPAAAVFCIQPAFSDFKPHWALIVWWPIVLDFAFNSGRSDHWARWSKYQAGYGLFLSGLILVSCHLPLAGWFVRNVSGISGSMDPRLDVTNDFYGWSQLESYLASKLSSEDRSLSVIGSRYQTAAQAKFALAKMNVTLLPRDSKELDEWPSLGVTEMEGPDWPKLKSSVLFVTDNRYSSEPRFPFSDCKKIVRFEKDRFNLLAKWIDVWRCVPQKS
jgi:hypothetical protein